MRRHDAPQVVPHLRILLSKAGIEVAGRAYVQQFHGSAHRGIAIGVRTLGQYVWLARL
jgi:hypothetical protein